MNLPVDAKVLLVWDACKAQSSEAVKETLADLDIVTVMVPKNMTHLLQPLDLTTNTTFKRKEKIGFSTYFTECIANELRDNPTLDVTTIDID